MDANEKTLQATPSGDAGIIRVPAKLFIELVELADIGLIEASAAMEMGLHPTVKASTLHEALALLQEYRQNNP